MHRAGGRSSGLVRNLKRLELEKCPGGGAPRPTRKRKDQEAVCTASSRYATSLGNSGRITNLISSLSNQLSF